MILDEPTNHLDFDTQNTIANNLNEYNGTIEIPLKPASGYCLQKVTVIDSKTLQEIQVFTEFETITIKDETYDGIKLENTIDDIQVKILFTAEE